MTDKTRSRKSDLTDSEKSALPQRDRDYLDSTKDKLDRLVRENLERKSEYFRVISDDGIRSGMIQSSKDAH